MYGSNFPRGIAHLNGQLFIYFNGYSQVMVYDTTTYQLRRQITLPSAASHGGMAASPMNNYLYVSDHYSSQVYQVDLSVTNTNRIVTWNVQGRARGVSVTSTGNVLVIVGDYTIREYTASGSLVRSVSCNNRVWRAVEVSNGVWAVSMCGPVNGITMMYANGTQIKSFGWATAIGEIAIDTAGYILALDTNGRLLVLDPSWSVARQLLFPVTSQPCSIDLDQSQRLLYIGDIRNMVLVFNGTWWRHQNQRYTRQLITLWTAWTV